MSAAVSSYDLTPVVTLLVMGALLAALPLAWVGWRHRREGVHARLRALTVLTVFLTFDLIVFGAFTRLTDSGLGCPDWPGCYGSASPLGANAQIHAAQTAMPTGPVTFSKAWIEMIHRYLATAVGALITVLMVVSWVRHVRRSRAEVPGVSPWWPTVTWLWVCAQGAFGALTVTMKLYPAVVTGHLLGGVGLLMLLVIQSERYRPVPLRLPRRGVRWLALLLVLCLAQVSLGAWVSTNYAVLACTDFPTCQSQWWPAMDFTEGFSLLRELGVSAHGAPLSFAALTAIHMAHRLGALLVSLALLGTVWWLARQDQTASRRWALVLGAVLVWQLLTGLGNVVLGWPLVAALAHTAGAAALLGLLAVLLTRACTGAGALPSPRVS